MFHPLSNAVREGREHHAGYVGEVGFYGTCHVESVVVCITRHTNHEVDISCLEHLSGLLCRADLREHRRIAQSEPHILVINLLLNAPVVLQHKGIIRVGYNQDVIYTPHHEIHERHVFQQAFTPLLWYFLFHYYSVIIFLIYEKAFSGPYHNGCEDTKKMITVQETTVQEKHYITITLHKEKDYIMIFSSYCKTTEPQPLSKKVLLLSHLNIFILRNQWF